MDKIWHLVFNFFLISAYFDPLNSFGSRTILLMISGAICVLVIPKLVLNINRWHKRFFFVFFIPIYGVLLYILRGGQFQNFSDTSYISSAVVIASTLVFKRINFSSLLRYIYTVSLAFSLLLFASAFELVLSDSRNIIDYIFTHDIGRVAFRTYGGIDVPFIYFFASPLLLLPIGIIVSKLLDNTILNYERFLLFVFTFALLLSGTRSHIFISICVFLIYIHKLRNILYQYLFFLFVFVLVILPNLNVFQQMLGMNNESNSFKFSMLKVYSEVFSEPLSFLFGQGFNAHAWDFRLSDILQGDASKSELTYLEYIRVFGFPSFLYFIYIVISSFNIVNVLRVSFILLLVDSLLNPHLFSTYGSIIVGLYLNKYE